MKDFFEDVGEQGEAFRFGDMRVVNALRGGKADEAGDAVPAISSSVMASWGFSSVIVQYAGAVLPNDARWCSVDCS